MFASVTNVKKRAKLVKAFEFLVSMLSFVPEGATAPIGFGLIDQKTAAELVAGEPTLCAINTTVPPDAEGKVQVAVIASAYQAYLVANPAPTAEATASEAAASAETVVFEISNDVPLPSIQRGGGIRESKYPFSQLVEGASFTVKGATAQGFASTIAGQNKKYKGANPKVKFTVRTIKNGVDNEKIDGVRVFRLRAADIKEKPEKTVIA